ncbi:vinculin-like [Bufo gargarizans]|uniref:vinculin-like n=1 Tax=Bufo gargarizans TaxID=30331 RepID=UPI001CF25D85|nr:vinculin-like [Bufo gargarizans]
MMMDSFSYCDISSVFITKTIDRIISPMAVQLCHLIISLECDGSKYTVISGDLEQMAQELSRFTEHFANTSLRLGVECDDGILGQEMEKAAKSLLIIGKSILLSVQKLSIQPAIRKHQDELVIAAQNILMGTLKILQLEDDAGVRKIHQAADWLLECLTYLQKAESISHLWSHFWEFSEALLLLNSLTENRILDLKDSLHQKHLAQKLQILRKCVPMLYTATQSSINHPYNEQIIESKLYIFDQTSKTVQDLKHLLITDPSMHEIKKQGSFAQELYNLCDILTDPKPTNLYNSDLDFLVGAIIFYCMYVAGCSRPNIKLQLVKHCQTLLEQRKQLCDHLKELQQSPGGNHFDIEEQCASMRIQLNHINTNLISSIFYQILDAFSVKDPLKRLLKAALKINKKASWHSEHLFASKAFQPLLQAFQNHTDQLLKISSLVLAQCSQERLISEIQSSVDCLCRVRDDVVALVLDTNKAYFESKMFEKAQSIYHKWIQATESLIMSLDGILTIHQFLELSIREIEGNKYHCDKLLRSQEAKIFQHHASDLCDLAERVAQVVTRHVDQSKNPIFRNGLRVLVRQLETYVLETRTAMIKCVEKISCFKAQNHFLEKVNNLLESIHIVQEGVTGSKHPDLLSPLRNEGGPVSHKLMPIDLNESEESKEDNEKKHRGQHITYLSYEEYLSKPVPLANTVKTIRDNANVENTIQL